jgi:hypothetical protein
MSEWVDRLLKVVEDHAESKKRGALWIVAVVVGLILLGMLFYRVGEALGAGWLSDIGALLAVPLILLVFVIAGLVFSVVFVSKEKGFMVLLVILSSTLLILLRRSAGIPVSMPLVIGLGMVTLVNVIAVKRGGSLQPLRNLLVFIMVALAVISGISRAKPVQKILRYAGDEVERGVDQVVEMPVSCSSMEEMVALAPFFTEEGPRYWYSVMDSGEIELFKKSGVHPRTARQLQPITEGVVRQLELLLKNKQREEEIQRAAQLAHEKQLAGALAEARQTFQAEFTKLDRTVMDRYGGENWKQVLTKTSEAEDLARSGKATLAAAAFADAQRLLSAAAAGAKRGQDRELIATAKAEFERDLSQQDQKAIEQRGGEAWAAVATHLTNAQRACGLFDNSKVGSAESDQARDATTAAYRHARSLLPAAVAAARPPDPLAAVQRDGQDRYLPTGAQVVEHAQHLRGKPVGMWIKVTFLSSIRERDGYTEAVTDDGRFRVVLPWNDCPEPLRKQFAFRSDNRNAIRVGTRIWINGSLERFEGTERGYFKPTQFHIPESH